MAVIDAARVAVAATILVYASITDLRVRRVPNRTWLVGGGIGAALLAIDVSIYNRLEAGFLVAIPIIAALAYVFWYFHLIAGGADAKAIMMLAILIPYPFDWSTWNVDVPLWSSPLPPTVVTFANSLLAFLAMPFLFLVYNLARGDLRFPAMLLGYRMDLARAEGSFVWITERLDADGRSRQILMSSKQTPEEEAENLARLRAAGMRRVWVTPKIPFMVPLLAGFVAMLIVGDVFTKLVTLALPIGR